MHISLLIQEQGEEQGADQGNFKFSCCPSKIEGKVLLFKIQVKIWISNFLINLINLWNNLNMCKNWIECKPEANPEHQVITAIITAIAIDYHLTNNFNSYFYFNSSNSNNYNNNLHPDNHFQCNNRSYNLSSSSSSNNNNNKFNC